MLYKKAAGQNIEKEIVAFEVFEVVDKEIYAQVMGKNMLVKFIPGETKMEIIDFHNEYYFKQCVVQKDQWYCVDNLGEALIVYDLKSHKSNTYCLDAHTKEDNNIALIGSFEEYIAIVSQYRGIIYIFDTVNKKMSSDEALDKKIEERYGKRDEYFIRGCIIDNYIYFIVSISEDYYICRYDLQKKGLEEVPVNVSFSEVRTCYYYEHKLYILQNDFTINIWNIEDNTIDMLFMSDLKQLIEKVKLKYKYAFSAMAVTERNIWLFPAGENDDIYVYNILEKNAYRYDNYPADFFYFDKKGWSKYGDIKERSGFIYVASRLSNYYLVINKETGIETWEPMCTADFREYYDHVITQRYIKDGEIRTIIENSNIPLKAFLFYQQKEMTSIEEKDRVGERIWGALK